MKRSFALSTLALVSALMLGMVAGQISAAAVGSQPLAGSKPDIFPANHVTRSTSRSSGPAARKPIKQELTGLRTANSRTYKLDGKYETDIYAGSLNYKDSRGLWQVIDDTLTPVSTPGYAYKNKANRYTALLPSNLAATPVRVSSGSSWAEFGLTGSAGSPTATGQTATYPNALPGVSLAFAAQADALKESVILQSGTAPSTFVYNLRLSPGITARPNAAGGIDFMNAAGQNQFAFAPPYMFDSTRPGLSKAVSMRLAQTPTGQTVTLAADRAWLADAARVFPVVIDPTTIWNNTNYYGGQDCYLQNASPTTNFCSSAAYTGTTDWVGNNGSSINRSLFSFPIQTGYDHIVPNSNILDAELDLTLASSSSTGAVAVNAYQVTNAWNENYTTWNNRDNGVAWSSPGGDYNGTVLDTENIGPAAGAVQFKGLTTTIQNWVNGNNVNNGLLIRAANEGAAGLLQFDNQAYGTSGTDPNRPHLRVQWNGWFGEEGFFKYETHKINDRMETGVNVANGNLVIHTNDLSIQGTGVPLNIDRYYNSLSGDSWHVGNSWSINTGCDIRLDIDDLDGISYHGPDGYAVLFHSNGTNSWATPPGENADLTKNSDGTYVMKWHANGAKFNFQTGGCLQSIVDKNNNTITMSYNGSVQSITDTQNRLTQFSYGSSVSSDFITQIQDPIGRKVQYAYNGNGDLTSYTDANNKVTTYSYNANDGISQIKDPVGNIVNFSYETAYPHRVTQIAYVNASCSGGSCTTGFAYNSGVGSCNASGIWGNTVVTDANGHTTTYCYDNSGRVTKVLDANGNPTKTTYNSNSNVSQFTNSGNQIDTISYDPNNNVSGAQIPTGAKSSYGYTDSTNKYSATNFTDPQGNQSTYKYDGFGNLQTITNAQTTQNQASFTYNANGTTKTMTDPLGHVTSFSYDANGNLTGITPPLPLQPESATVDGVSRVSSGTDGKGQKTSYAYDAMDRLTQITYADNSTIVFTYDADGNLKSQQDNTGTTTFTYDTMNRMTSKTLPGLGTISYAYDGVSNLTSTTDAGGTVSYAYSPVNLVTTITEPNGKSTTLGYDNQYNRTSTAYPNGVTLTMTFDNSSRLLTIVAKNGSGGTLSSYSYSYLNGTNDTALRQSMTDNVTGYRTSYTYDRLNRLVDAKTMSGSTQISDYTYAYDADSNRTSQTVNGSGTSYGYNAANEMTSAGSVTYSYDANGAELSNSSGLAITYNNRSQTTSIKPAGGSAVNMTYTGPSQAERVTAGNTTMAYSLIGLGSSSLSGTNTYFTHDPVGGLVEERIGSGSSYTAYYYIFDGLGSVIALTDGTGAVVNTYKYDPYGNLTTSTGSVANPWMFTGAYYDSATHYYKVGGRFYDPSIGRWTQPDSAGSGYDYAGDDPVSGIDPMGQWFFDLGVSAGPYVAGVQFNADGYVLYGGEQFPPGKPGVSLNLAPMADLKGNQTSVGAGGCYYACFNWATSNPRGTVNSLLQGNPAGAWQTGDWEAGIGTPGFGANITTSTQEVTWSSVWNTVDSWLSGLFN